MIGKPTTSFQKSYTRLRFREQVRAMTRNVKQVAGRVFLVSYQLNGEVLNRLELSNEAYYEEITPLIDSAEFRSRQGVRRLTGEIYGSKGSLQQSFELLYDEIGNRTKRTMKFADGTEISDSELLRNRTCSLTLADHCQGSAEICSYLTAGKVLCIDSWLRTEVEPYDDGLILESYPEE